MTRELYPWFVKTWSDLDVSRLPHALLFHGQSGIGKFDFALRFAKKLLCESSAAIKPCNCCEACNWFDKGNHPDFVGLLPEVVGHLLPQDVMDGDDGKITKKTAKQDMASEGGSDKKQSQFIKVESIRDTLESLGTGAHRFGHKIILIYPLEALQVVSANALLKTLEEPPENTIFILVSSRIDRILPTIKSRCRMISMSRPSEAIALDWMRGELNKLGLVSEALDLSSSIKEAGGSVLQAFSQIIGEGEYAADAEMRKLLLVNLAKGKEINWLGTSEKIFKLPMSDVLITLERWVSDVLSYKIAQSHYFFPKYGAKIADCARSANTSKLTQFWKRLVEARRYELHPLSSRLQIEALLIDYRDIFKS